MQKGQTWSSRGNWLGVPQVGTSTRETQHLQVDRKEVSQTHGLWKQSPPSSQKVVSQTGGGSPERMAYLTTHPHLGDESLLQSRPALHINEPDTA